MNRLKIVAAALAGLILGAALFHPHGGQAQGFGRVHVSIIPVEAFNTKALVSQDLPGLKVAGISCVPKPRKNLPDAAVCYVATADK